MRLPWADGDERGRRHRTEPVGDVDACIRTADLEDQMAFAVRVDVERPVELINGRATKSAMKNGDRSAHRIPPVACCTNATGFTNPRGNARAVCRGLAAPAANWSVSRCVSAELGPGTYLSVARMPGSVPGSGVRGGHDGRRRSRVDRWPIPRLSTSCTRDWCGSADRSWRRRLGDSLASDARRE